MLKIMNNQLQPINEMLIELSLKGTQSRMRTKFIEKINQGLEQFNKERLQLIKDYAELDSDGEPIIEENQYKIKPENIKDFEDDFKELMLEDYEIEVTDIVKKMIKTILPCIDEVEGLQGEKALTHAYLYDKLEEALEK